MRLPRRTFLYLGAAAAALPALAGLASAQSYPSRPVRIIVGFAAGGPTDVLARLIGRWLSARLNQQFVVENRPGASGNLATEAVVNAPADGYTLLMVSPSNMINATLYDNLKFGFIRDVAPVASVLRTYYVMEINPSLPVSTVPEFIAYAKARPGGLSMSSAGSGTPQHVAGELFKMMTGVDMVHVPYRGGGPALTDLIGGQVQVYFGPMPPSIEHIRSGKLRALGVTSAGRSQALPDIPSVSDFVPGYEASQWHGIGVPKNTPSEIIDKLNKEINASLVDLKMKARLADLGGTPLVGSPADFSRLIAEDTEKWAKVIKFAGIKLE